MKNERIWFILNFKLSYLTYQRTCNVSMGRHLLPPKNIKLEIFWVPQWGWCLANPMLICQILSFFIQTKILPTIAKSSRSPITSMNLFSTFIKDDYLTSFLLQPNFYFAFQIQIQIQKTCINACAIITTFIVVQQH